MRAAIVALVGMVMLAGCKGGDHSGDDGVVPDAAGTTGPFEITANVSGVSGTGLTLALTTSGAPLEKSVDADGAVSFGTLPKDTAFDLVVTHQPTSGGVVCHAAAPPSPLRADAMIAITCAPSDLELTEIGPCVLGCWLELHNASAAPLDLVSYHLTTSGGLDAPLPAHTVAANGYVVVKVGGPNEYPNQQIVVVDDPNYGWSQSGNGWIVLKKGTTPIDSVVFGNATNAPANNTWVGPNTVAHTDAALVRAKDDFDSDRARDWSEHAFMTPGGPNDITSDVDADVDGIPDQAEVQGGTYAGLDLYALGARTQQKDIFVEIDHMTSSDVGLTPKKEALARAAAVFAPHQIVVHFDVGPLYAATLDPANYNLGGGEEVPFTMITGFDVNVAGGKSVHQYKAEHFDIRRLPIFHYVLWGHTEQGGSAGLGERPGNDVTVTIGGIHTSDPAQANFLINDQASVLVHELGHNLGLAHGGDAEVNYKPNYYSIMNYLYRTGLSTIGNAEGDRYQLFRGSCGVASTAQLANGLNTTTAIIDFSNGTSAPLNEATVQESAGLGRNGSVAVDYDCSGTTNNGYAFDVNKDGQQTVLTDYDDWGHISLPFAQSSGGSQFAKVAVDLVDDRQYVSPEQPRL
ncbi:MAG TPA: hypothetical protein VGM90_11345 [Kofleriaceae bacterium]|jgi:hypothetical protein